MKNLCSSKIWLLLAGCLCSLGLDLKAQSRFETGSYQSLGGNIDGKAMVTAFEGHFKTDFRLATPVGEKDFVVKPSRGVVSGTPGTAYFEGVGKDNPNETVFIQVRPWGTMINYHNAKDNSLFTLAPREHIDKAAFGEVINQRLGTAASGARQAKDHYLRSFGTAYAWVDEQAVQELLATDRANRQNPGASKLRADSIATRPGPTASRMAADGDTHTGELQYEADAVLGKIGKRELLLHLYDYGDVSEYDWGKAISYMKSSINSDVDSRFANIQFTFKEYFVRNGQATLDGIKITNAEFNWDNSESTSIGLAKFKSYMLSRFPGWDRADNRKHMLLSRWHWFSDGAAGNAYREGKYAMAQVWSGDEDGFVAPPNVLGSMLGAKPGGSCWYGAASGHWTWYDDVMASGSGCIQVYHHTIPENKDRIDAHMSAAPYRDEILNQQSELPRIRNADYAEDLLTVSDNTVRTSIYLGGKRYDTKPLFDEQNWGTRTEFGVNGDHLAVYRIKLPASTYYQIKITSADYDTYLHVLDKNGNFVAKDDDSGGDYKSKISGNFNKDWYYVVVGGWGHDSGNFTLKVRYGWYDQGWRVSAEQTAHDIPVRTPTGKVIDMDNGNLVYEADFGENTKIVKEIIKTEAALYVYPNPVEGDRLNISGGEITNETKVVYKITDAAGRVLQTGAMLGIKDGILLGKNIRTGSYVVELTLADQKQTIHFVVK